MFKQQGLVNNNSPEINFAEQLGSSGLAADVAGKDHHNATKISRRTLMTVCAAHQRETRL
jgi:hypothetical protein